MNPANGAFAAQWTRLKQSLTRRGRRKDERSLSPDPVWVHVNPRRPSSSRRTHSSCTTRPSLDLYSPISFDPPPIDHSHNEKLAISRLPPEILADIFLIVCEAGGLTDYSWTACSQVCVAWRAIALDTPTLWSHVIFSTSGWTRRCIERSKSAPLIVEANMTYSGLEDRVCGVLKLAHRIQKINLQFFSPSPLAITLLNGPFPILRSLSVNVSNYFLSPTLTLNPDAYPMLRHLHFRSNVTFFPSALPAGLVSLEISNGSDGGVPWEIFAQSLQCLTELEILTLHEFAVPPTSAARIPLPALRELHLSACPADCARLVEALDAPGLRRYGLHLRTVDDAPTMFATVLGSFAYKPTPKSMFLHRQYGSLGSDQWYQVSQPFPDPGFYQHTVFGFAYADARDAEVATLDICFTWRIPLTDSDLASIFSAIADIPGPLLERVEWLRLADWNSSPPGTWAPFLRRLTGLKNLLISGLPASGLVWDLLDQLETPTRLLVEKPLLPSLEELEINSIDCSAGGWIPRRPQRTVNSYIDLDGARFIEVLICYLEARHKMSSAFSSSASSITPPPLARLKITRAINYTAAEIKLLRRLVGQVLWDGVGSMPSTYAFNGDEYGALTINHNVLSRRGSYRELEMGEEERWRRQFWALQMRG